MNVRKTLGLLGFALAIIGGYLWIINQISLSLILWGAAVLIIIRLNRLKKKLNKTTKRKL
jgi:hypothetical protein